MLSDLACRKAMPRDKAYKLADSNGLHLYITPSGFKSWRWKYRYAKKEKQLVLGPYPELSLTQARELRVDAARMLRQGIDPALQRRQQRAAREAAADSSFKTWALRWIEQQEAVWTPRYKRLIEQRFEADVYPRIGSLPLSGITVPMVLEVLRPIERRGAVETAHRVRQRIDEVFTTAIAAGVDTANPAASTARALAKPSKGRFPAVRTVKEAREVLRATEALPGHPLTKLASRFLALTAARSQMVRAAEPSEFEDLDGDAPIWRVPAAKMKLLQERKDDPAFEFILPLSRQAVETVRAAMQLSGKAALIFRSIRHPRRPLSDSTISKAYREAGFAGVHVPHGWRSTFSTVMNELAKLEGRDHDHAVIDLMLAHQPKGVEARYNRAAYMPRRREIAQRWADLLTEGLPHPEDLIDGKRI